jgi:hypothetical protein
MKKILTALFFVMLGIKAAYHYQMSDNKGIVEEANIAKPAQIQKA